MLLVFIKFHLLLLYIFPRAYSFLMMNLEPLNTLYLMSWNWIQYFLLCLCMPWLCVLELALFFILFSCFEFIPFCFDNALTLCARTWFVFDIVLMLWIDPLFLWQNGWDMVLLDKYCFDELIEYPIVFIIWAQNEYINI